MLSLKLQWGFLIAMKQFIIVADVLWGKKILSVEREIWAETPKCC